MKGIPQGRYTKEFRDEAVKIVVDGGMSLPEAARRLSLSASTLSNWLKASKAGKLKDIDKNYRPLPEIEMELTRFRKELAYTKIERDLLKKRPRSLLRSRCSVRDDERLWRLYGKRFVEYY
jgi:transposase-like protein